MLLVILHAFVHYVCIVLKTCFRLHVCWLMCVWKYLFEKVNEINIMEESVCGPLQWSHQLGPRHGSPCTGFHIQLRFIMVAISSFPNELDKLNEKATKACFILTVYCIDIFKTPI